MSIINSKLVNPCYKLLAILQCRKVTDMSNINEYEFLSTYILSFKKKLYLLIDLINNYYQLLNCLIAFYIYKHLYRSTLI